MTEPTSPHTTAPTVGLTTHSLPREDRIGNQQLATVEVTGWIKGDDQAALDAAWSKVGGQGPIPLRDGTSVSLGMYMGNYSFSAAGSAFFFGNISFKNLTPDFPASNFDGGNTWLSLVMQCDKEADEQACSTIGAGLIPASPPAMCIAYGSSTKCNSIGKVGLSSSPSTVMAAMESDSWGPAPFIAGFSNVFSPNYPQGVDLSLVQLKFSDSTVVSGNEWFSLATTW